MSHFLKRVLQADSPLFRTNLSILEKITGNSGIDVRIIADVTHGAHRVMRRLNLDPADTTARELYMALNSTVHSGLAEEVLINTDYVVYSVDGYPISFNMIDIIENVHHDLSFDNRSLTRGQRSLKGEIVTRYIEHDSTDEKTTKQLASEAGLLYKGDIMSDQPISQTASSDDKTPYVLAVGDIISDAFIKLSEDHAKVETDEQGYQRVSFELGAKLPYDEVEIVKAVECSPNAAVSMTRLGLKTSLVSWIGDDETGAEMIKYLDEQRVGTSDIVVEAGKKSNYHYVLRYGADRTKLQKFEDYEYKWREPAVKPDWLYLGVLGEKTWPLHESIMEYLEAHPEIKLCFQPGMYHLMWGSDKLADFYKRAEIVIMNREEAAEVTKRSREDVAGLIDGLHEMGVTVAVVTDGPAGAYASTEGEEVMFMPNYPDPQKPYDRTGAGDAFASTITAALALGETLQTALTWAPINSMHVVQKMGAQAGLLSRDEIMGYLAEAPDWYHTTPLSEKTD